MLPSGIVCVCSSPWPAVSACCVIVVGWVWLDHFKTEFNAVLVRGLSTVYVHTNRFHLVTWLHERCLFDECSLLPPCKLFTGAFSERINPFRNVNWLSLRAVVVCCCLVVCPLSLQTFTNPKDVTLACYRRSLCYPLYRNWQLTERVWKDVLEILTIGNSPF